MGHSQKIAPEDMKRLNDFVEESYWLEEWQCKKHPYSCEECLLRLDGSCTIMDMRRAVVRLFKKRHWIEGEDYAGIPW